MLRVVASAEGIDHGADGRIIDDTGGEHAAQDAVNHVIESRHGDLAVFDGFLQRRVEVVVVAGHLLIEAVERGLDGAVGRAPVGDDPALELEVLLQDLVEQVVVLAGVVAFDEVVGAHDAGGVGDADGDLEGEQVGLAHGFLVEQNVDDGAAGLLIVEGIVLDVAHHVLREDALFELPVMVPARMGSSPAYSKLRPLRGSRVMLTPPPMDMLKPRARSSRPMTEP